MAREDDRCGEKLGRPRLNGKGGWQMWRKVGKKEAKWKRRMVDVEEGGEGGG